MGTEVDHPVSRTNGAARIRPRLCVRIRPPRARRAAQSAATPPHNAPGRLASGQNVEVRDELLSPRSKPSKMYIGRQVRKVAATKFAPTNTARSKAAAGLIAILAIFSIIEIEGEPTGAEFQASSPLGFDGLTPSPSLGLRRGSIKENQSTAA